MDGESGPGVGAVTISVQAGGVGITMFGEGVIEELSGVAGGAAQAERINDRTKNEEMIRMLNSVSGMPQLHRIACLSSAKEVIQAIALMNSSSEVLCSRSARTAGPTGSSPAAPPGVSA